MNVHWLSKRVSRAGQSRVRRILAAFGSAGGCLLLLLTFVPSAGAALPSFGDSRFFGGSIDRTFTLALGDLDDDGDLDIAVGRSTGSVVYLNDGAANLGLPQGVGPTDWTASIAVGDMDGDGDLDIVAGNSGGAGGRNVVYLNDGSANFADPRNFGPGSDRTEAVAVGDLDGDGDLDIAAGNWNEQNVVYLNDGSAHFYTGTINCADPPDNARCFGTGTDATKSLGVGDLNGDDNLDIVAGNNGMGNVVYLNDGLANFADARDFGPGSDATEAVAVGDLNGDGDLDIAAGNAGQQNVIYMNDGSGGFYTGTIDCAAPPDNARCFGTGTDETRSLAVGDLDGDGDMDIGAGNWDEQNAAYLNDGTGQFSHTASFGTSEDSTTSVTAGDLDDDGALDLIVGNDSQQSAAYLNDASGSFAPIRSLAQTQYTAQVRVGDMDGDGDLDIFVHGMQSRIYLNDGAGAFPLVRDVGASGSPSTRVANAVADMDGDRDLDILSGRVIYLNDGSANFYTGTVNCADPPDNARCFGPGPSSDSRSVVVGDLDGDGDLDIAVGNWNKQNLVYLNDGSAYFYTGTVNCADPPANASCFGTGSDATRSLAVGDLDGDGDLDLVAGNYLQLNTVHLNSGMGRFDWSGATRGFGTGTDGTQSVALGDLDGDGDPDIIVGNSGGPNAVYLNDGAGQFGWSGAAHNFGPGSDTTTSVVVGDVDGDGDSDIWVGNTGSDQGEPNAIYVNDGAGGFAWSSPVREFGSGEDWANGVAVGDLDGNGTLDVVIGNAYSGNWLTSTVCLNGAREPERLAGNLPYLTVTHPGSSAAANLYSSAEVLTTTIIPITYTLFDREGESVGHIEAYYSPDGGGRWLPAVAASGTITELVATPAGTAHVFAWDTFASSFFGQSDNVVFRIEAYPSLRPYTDTIPGPFQWPYAAATTFPFRVRGTQIRVLHDNTPVADAIVYRMSGDETVGEAIADGAGVPFRTDSHGYLRGRGTLELGDRLVALLPISSTESYTLFYTSAVPTVSGVLPYTVTAAGVQTLTVAADNPLLLLNLDVSLQWDARKDTQFMEQLTFDLQRTSAFLYDWTDGQAALGEVTIHHDRAHWADADIRIYATNRLRPCANQGGITAEVISDTQLLTITYAPGMVHMPATWNRYGDVGGSLGGDWPRTLAHELGHYAFFLDDNYLGFDDQGRLIPVEGCPGAMTDPYREDWPYDEIHPAGNWLPECADTLSQRVFGRADWATVELFYPWLSGTLDNPGPSNLPLAVTALTFVEPVTPPTTLEDPTFYLLDEGGGMLQPGASARAVLFHDDLFADLGQPIMDRVLARGARLGDRLCVYEPEAGRLGCETIAANDNQLTLWGRPDWQPEILLTPLDTTTIAVTVTNTPAGLSLSARLYPFNGPGLDTVPLFEDGSAYTGVLTGTEPLPAAYVHVWVNEGEPRREALTDYVLGSNPGRIYGTLGAPARGRSSPAVSADGQAILFGNLEFPDGEFYALQALTHIPAPLPWATPVGHAYRLLASPGAPDLTAASLSLAYMAADVVPGEERWIRMYFWDGAAWHLRPTTLDTTANMAAASCQGEGIYALMSSIEIPLEQGWNLLAYPIPETRPVTETLLSIQGAYTLVYGYDSTVPGDPWAVYGPGAPDWVNDLETFVFGRGYWISATEAITLYLKGAGGEQQAWGGFPNPPAMYYGPVLSSDYFTPTPGMTVTAWVDGHLCGQSTALNVAGQVVYVIGVHSDDEVTGCGAPGRAVTFRVAGQTMSAAPAWNNGRLWPLDLRPNRAPVAVDDPVTTLEDTAVLVAVLANDVDPDSDPLVLVAVGTPAHGGAVIDNGAVLYTPDPNYNGADAFSYVAGDGVLTGTASVAVTVTAVNDAPLTQDDAYTTAEDTPLSVAAPGVLGNDSDVDGDPLLAVLLDGPAEGVLALDADGAFLYMPPFGFTGVVTWTYQAGDGVTLSGPALVAIAVQPSTGWRVYLPVLFRSRGG